MWIITAWQCISPDGMVKGFKNCCMSSAVVVIGDDMLWNGSEDDGTVRSECEEYEDGDSDSDWDWKYSLTTCFVC